MTSCPTAKSLTPPTVDSAPQTHGASQLWHPVFPPLPTTPAWELFQQLSDTKNILTDKLEELANLNIFRKRCEARIEDLQKQLQIALHRGAQTTAATPIRTSHSYEADARSPTPPLLEAAPQPPFASQPVSPSTRLWGPVLPPPPTYAQLVQQLSDAKTTLADKNEELAKLSHLLDEQEAHIDDLEHKLQAAPALPLQVRQPRLIFSIVTFGLRTLRLENKQYPHHVIVRALANVAPLFHADVLIDARPFHDPAGQNVGHGHTGMHRDILTRIAARDAFKATYQQSMHDVLHAVPQRRRQDDEHVGIAIYCKAGKHRSVALSIFIELGLRRYGRDVAETHHLSRDTWPWCHGNCYHCRNAYSTAERLLIERGLL